MIKSMIRRVILLFSTASLETFAVKFINRIRNRLDIYSLLPPCHDCDILPSDSSVRTELLETAGDPCTEPRLPGCWRFCGELGCMHT